MSVDARPHESGSAKGTLKCRIPQRLSTFRNKPIPCRQKLANDVIRQRGDPALVSQMRYSQKASPMRPKSSESRPKFSNRIKDDWTSEKSQYSGRHPRSDIPDRRAPIFKRPATLPRKINFPSEKRFQRPIITVPVSITTFKPQRCNIIKNNEFPDQETIQKNETLEMQNLFSENESDAEQRSVSVSESSQFKSGQDMQLKSKWQESIAVFEQMKHDLKERQQDIISLYAKMRNAHKKLLTSGEKVSLPSTEELRIMNVHKLSPEQLLQLCALHHPNDNPDEANNIQLIDTNKLHNAQKKLVATCELSLQKRREMIDWFEALRCEEKKVSMRVLTTKTNEFILETEQLESAMAQARDEMDTEINDVVDFVRKNLNEAVALQLRSEKLTLKLAEVNSRNEDLQKQIRHLEHLKSTTNRGKLEELEKELAEEKCKRLLLRDKLSKSEGQVMMEKERAAQLDATLTQARSQIWSLERTVQQLHEQNQKLQNDFDNELTTLKESIKENSRNLEEIAAARELLQNEKLELETRLKELTTYYNELLSNLKHESELTLVKLIDTESKYEQVVKEKKALESKVDSLTNRLKETEDNEAYQSRVEALTNRLIEIEACTNAIKIEIVQKDKKLALAEAYIDDLKNETQEKERLVEEAKAYQGELNRQIQEKEKILSTAMGYEKQLQSTKQDLNKASIKLEEYKTQVTDLKKIIKELKSASEESQKLEEKLRTALSTKEENVSKLKKTQSLLEHKLQDSEQQMELYKNQISSFNSEMRMLKEEVGEFETFRELRDLINTIRAKLIEATSQNDELKEELQKKEVELEQHLESVAEQEQLIQQRDDVIKMLSDKNDEHVEMRTRADDTLNQIIVDKNREIESLLTNLETRKQQKIEMEKIILALEEKCHKFNKQKTNDEEKIKSLEQKLVDYNAYHMGTTHNQMSSHNMDSLIKILEDELGTSYVDVNKKKNAGDRKQDKNNCFDNHKGNKRFLQSDGEAVPTKIVMPNFVKKTQVPKARKESLEHEKAISNNDTQKYNPTIEPNVYFPPIIKDNNYPPFRGLLPAGCHIKDNLMSRNTEYLTSSQLRGYKKSKMFKFAGHKI